MIWLGVLIVIAVLFLIFPQQMGGLLAVILVGIGITALIIFIDSYSTEKAEESVSIVASYVPASCSEDCPLHFKITNRSKKIVNKVEWNITATREGYSNNVVSYIFSGYGYGSEYATPFSSDKILKPDEFLSVCHMAPSIKTETPPQNLIWKVSNKRIKFQ